MSQASAPRRAVLRWALRLFRREWRQQITVLALVTVAVAAAVAGAAFMTNAASAGEDAAFGDATALSHVPNADPARAQVELAALGRRFGAMEVISHAQIRVPGSADAFDLRSQDPHGRFGAPLLALRAGRYPSAANEVAITPQVGKGLGLHVGETATFGGASRMVVGMVENPRALGDAFALLPPGVPGDSYTALFMNRAGLPVGSTTSSAEGDGPHTPVLVRGNSDQGTVAAVVVVTTLAMLLVALIAAAGFIVVAQRRQRQLGLLAAIGATERHVRLVMAGNGAIVGAVAAVAGTLLGVAGWVVASPAAESIADHRIGRLDLPWGLVAQCAVLGVVAATAAAWWPTRAVTKLPIMVALSGRPAKPASVHRSALVALVFAGLGVGGIVAAHPTGRTVSPLPLMGGLAALVAALVFIAPTVVRLCSPLARRAPFVVRLALRDLVRYHARAAAALAAIGLVLAITVSLAGTANANLTEADEGNLPNNEMLIRVDTSTYLGDPAMRVSDATGHEADAAAIAAKVDGADVWPLSVALGTAPNGEPQPVSTLHQESAHSYSGLGATYVATPELLQRIGVDQASLASDVELVTTAKESAVLLDMSRRPDEHGPTTVVKYVSRPFYVEGGSSLIVPSALAAHGWTSMPTGWLVHSTKPLTSEQISSARKVAARLGMTTEVRSSDTDVTAIRNTSTLVGLIVAIVIAAMTVGLIRSEAASDIRTLTATGATSFTRRALTATTSGALAALGILLGVGAAYVALVTTYHAELDKLTPVPLAQLVELAVLLPLGAAAAGWLLGNQQPRAFARQLGD